MSAAPHHPVARSVRLGLAASLLLLALQTVVGLVAALELDSFSSPFDLERNNGIPDLVSTAAILAAALGAALLAAADVQRRWLGAPLAVLLLVVSVEDAWQAEADRGSVRGISVIISLAAAAVLVLGIARHAPKPAGFFLLVGLLILTVAVKNDYEYDQLLNVFGRGDQARGDFDYELGIVIKQGLELLGWSAVAIGVWATALAARARRPRSLSENVDRPSGHEQHRADRDDRVQRH